MIDFGVLVGERQFAAPALRPFELAADGRVLFPLARRNLVLVGEIGGEGPVQD